MGTNWKESAEIAKFRSNIYGLLATIFRKEPTEALIKELRDPRLAGVFQELGVDLGEVLKDIPEHEVVESLSIEFTRLFIGPKDHISAHESIFTQLDGGMSALWGTTTVAVKSFIETTGLDYRQEFTGIPDHISVELEFMHKLALWEAEKWEQKDSMSAEYCQSIQRMFLEQHLSCWLPNFCAEVVNKTSLPFYRNMAELTQNFMQFEQQSIVH